MATTTREHLVQNKVLRPEPSGPSVEHEIRPITQIGEQDAIRNHPDQGVLVELTGFEPLTPSLRKMRSQLSDQEKCRPKVVLWGGCGSSHVRPRDTT